MNKITLKLIGVFIHQVTKPMSLLIIATSKRVSICRKLCISTSVLSRYWDNKIQEKLDLGENINSEVTKVAKKAVKHRYEHFKDVDQARDVHNGANILSELILYGTLTAYIINEANKSRSKEELVMEATQNDLRLLQYEIDDLKQQLRDHQIQINDYHVSDSIKPVILQLNEDRSLKPEIQSLSES